MKELRQLQETMADALMQPLTARDKLAASTAADFIKPNERLSSFQRLEIYARQYWFRLLDCLYDDYPALRAYLGQRRFHQLCRDYLAAHPSSSWTLRNLGHKLPEYLQDTAAGEIAQVEWAQILAFDEPAREPVCVDALVGADALQLRLGLQPYVVLLQLEHAVDHFITGIQKQHTEGRGSASQAMPEAPLRPAPPRKPRLKREQVFLVVHRHENRLYFKRLTPASFTLLKALRDGFTLSESLALITADSASVTQWFCEFTQLGWLTLFPSQTPPSHETPRPIPQHA
jgi:hypothetical protein